MTAFRGKASGMEGCGNAVLGMPCTDVAVVSLGYEYPVGPVIRLYEDLYPGNRRRLLESLPGG